MAEQTLQEQFEQFQAVIAEAEELGCELNSFVDSAYQAAKNRIDEGDKKPLSDHLMRAITYQQSMNERKRKNKGVAPGTYGTVTVPEEVKEKIEEAVANTGIRYARASVVGGNVVFDPASGISWIPNTGGLVEGSNYVLQLKAVGDTETVTNARIAGVFPDAPYKKNGKQQENLILPMLFQREDAAVYFPIVDPTFHIEPHIAAFFDLIYSNAETHPQKVLISGPQGTGKTTLVEQQSARHNRGFFRMSCGMVESPNEWFGFKDVQDGNIVYVTSAFIEAVQTPNTDILLDEFNRLHTTLQNGLYNILDDNGEAWLDAVKRNVRVAAGVVFWATANIGAAHTGTFAIDAAMEDRFSYHLKMGYLPEEDEIRVLMIKTGIGHDLAKNFVGVARRIRELAGSDDSIISKPISLRQLESAGRLVVGGMKPAESVEFTIMPKYSEEGGNSSEQAEVRKIFHLKFGARS